MKENWTKKIKRVLTGSSQSSRRPGPKAAQYTKLPHDLKKLDKSYQNMVRELGKR